jgi:hypothetical protein
MGNKVFSLSVDASSSYTYYGGHRWLLHGLLVAHESIKEAALTRLKLR